MIRDVVNLLMSPPLSVAAATTKTTSNKKLSYPQRKCASNVAILYSANGISI